MKEIRSVYVVGGDTLVCEMFHRAGWATVSTQQDANAFEDDLDLVCFTGGEDVTPEMYGETNQGSVGCNLSRDQEEVEVYNHYWSLAKPMVGICRGGQLLNVLNGGRMIQHLGETKSGHRRIHGFMEGAGSYEAGYVLVDHHQGMDADREHVLHIFDDDVQCTVFYPDTMTLCFQPHPEWGDEDTRILFFSLLNKYLGV